MYTSSQKRQKSWERQSYCVLVYPVSHSPAVHGRASYSTTVSFHICILPDNLNPFVQGFYLYCWGNSMRRYSYFFGVSLFHTCGRVGLCSASPYGFLVYNKKGREEEDGFSSIFMQKLMCKI